MSFEEPTVLTISKYPPYMSGHSFESMQQNKALLESTGRKHHELTYDACVYDLASNFNDDPDLMEQCETVAVVHRIGPPERNVKVFDGALIQRFIGKAITLVEHKDINVISTFYLDPHASIANRAREYGRDMLGRRIVVAHKAVGSDVLNSIANHYADGQGQLLMMDYLKGDLRLAVSHYTRDELIRHARHLQREGWRGNHKRIYRLYRLEGLSVRAKVRRKRTSALRPLLPAAQAPNEQ